MMLTRIRYEDLNSRQRESYNFHKVAAVLSDYGYTSIRLSDDWEGADFIAVHIDGQTSLRVQLKGRLTFAKKYLGKGLFIAFPNKSDWYLYPHDEVQEEVFALKPYGTTRSWRESGGYSVGGLGKRMREILEPYRLNAT